MGDPLLSREIMLPRWYVCPFWPENQWFFESMRCWIYLRQLSHVSLPFHLSLCLAYWQANEAHVSEISIHGYAPDWIFYFGDSNRNIFCRNDVHPQLAKSCLPIWLLQPQIFYGLPFVDTKLWPQQQPCRPVDSHTRRWNEKNLGIFERNSWKLGKIGE